MTKVLPKLYLGCADDAEMLAERNPEKIATVVNVNLSRADKKRSDITYNFIPLVDGYPVDDEDLDSVLVAITEGISNGKVLVHCAMGASRSPAMVALYLHSIKFKVFDAAIAHLEGIRPVVDPSPVVLDSVRKYIRRRGL